MTNAEFAKALRKIADFYGATPEMPQPHSRLNIYTYQRKEFVSAALELSRGGMVTKSADPPEATLSDYHATREFDGITIDVHIPRLTVCRLIRPAEYECPDSILELAEQEIANVNP